MLRGRCGGGWAIVSVTSQPYAEARQARAEAGAVKLRNDPKFFYEYVLQEFRQPGGGTTAA